MSNKSPIFPMPELHHFSDYGFDPQIDYFQVLEEARKHKRQTFSSRSSIDSLRFRLQKPISKDDSKKIKKNRKRWWKNALRFFRRRRSPTVSSDNIRSYCLNGGGGGGRYLSGPVYATESRSESSTPYWKTSRWSSGALAGTDSDVPYVNLKELNMEHTHRMSTSHSSMPIYFVT